MFGLLIAVLLAAVAYILIAALTGSGVLALLAGVLVLIGGIGYGRDYWPRP